MTRKFASKAEARRVEVNTRPTEGFCPHCRRDLDGGPGGLCSICVTGRVNLEPARTVLAGNPLSAMNYATAYRVVFGGDLVERCREMVAHYGEAAGKPFEDGGVCWELGQYGHTPAGMLDTLTLQAEYGM